MKEAVLNNWMRQLIRLLFELLPAQHQLINVPMSIYIPCSSSEDEFGMLLQTPNLGEGISCEQNTTERCLSQPHFIQSDPRHAQEINVMKKMHMSKDCSHVLYTNGSQCLQVCVFVVSVMTAELWVVGVGVCQARAMPHCRIDSHQTARAAGSIIRTMVSDRREQDTNLCSLPNQWALQVTPLTKSAQLNGIPGKRAML